MYFPLPCAISASLIKQSAREMDLFSPHRSLEALKKHTAGRAQRANINLNGRRCLERARELVVVDNRVQVRALEPYRQLERVVRIDHSQAVVNQRRVDVQQRRDCYL